MRVILVDDEALARSVLREYLARHADIEIVAECANGFEAVQAITEHEPDLAFLDVQMPKLDGFEVAELVRGKTHFVFATAYDQYALKAFEVHAVDYLLKPFSQERLDQALAHARKLLGAQDSQPELAAVLDEAAERRGKSERIVIRDGAQVHVLAAADVDYVEAQDDYVLIHAHGRSYLKAQRMAQLEEQLEAALFLRIHRSWLINIERLARIEQVARDSHIAILQDGTKVPISRSGYQKLKEAM